MGWIHGDSVPVAHTASRVAGGLWDISQPQSWSAPSLGWKIVTVSSSKSLDHCQGTWCCMCSKWQSFLLPSTASPAPPDKTILLRHSSQWEGGTALVESLAMAALSCNLGDRKHSASVSGGLGAGHCSGVFISEFTSMLNGRKGAQHSCDSNNLLPKWDTNQEQPTGYTAPFLLCPVLHLPQ